MKWKFLSVSGPNDGTAMIVVNDLGRDGWELVSVVFLPQRNVIIDITVYGTKEEMERAKKLYGCLRILFKAKRVGEDF